MINDKSLFKTLLPCTSLKSICVLALGKAFLHIISSTIGLVSYIQTPITYVDGCYSQVSVINIREKKLPNQFVNFLGALAKITKVSSAN